MVYRPRSWPHAIHLLIGFVLNFYFLRRALSMRVDDEVMTKAIGMESAQTRRPLAVTLQAAFDDAEETVETEIEPAV